MSRIRSIALKPIRLTPTEAELAIEFHGVALHATSEMHGRLMGPTCLYSTTIEVAHPIKMTWRGEVGERSLQGRAVIPEPAWWDPESPFLYHGPIELWEHESRVESTTLRCGLRHAEWKGEQLVWNGKPIELRSQQLTEIDEATLKASRQQGFNAVTVPAAIVKAASLIADRIGLLVLADPPLEIDSLLHPSVVPART